MTDPTAETGSEPDAEETPEPFANRAARRAKGKGGPGPAVGTGSQHRLQSGSVQSPRQYGNRRSG